MEKRILTKIIYLNMRKSSKKNFISALGKRKEASARVRLISGRGENLVNGVSLDKYFPGELSRKAFLFPFEVTGTGKKFYVTIKVRGGGKQGQLDASVHGIAKAFARFDPLKLKLLLRKAGLLTRDARERERRKVGTGGKARRKKQSPKR